MMPPLRPGRDADADGLIALIGACWGEYPGIVLDVDGEVPELRALASYFAGAGGALWVAEAGGTIVGMIGVRPAAGPDVPPAWEICKLYLARDRRGTGLAEALLRQAETHAVAAGAARLLLWSDTRFTRAHRFYEKHHYLRAGPIRALHDLSNSLEFGYAKPIAGCATLDAAAAASAVRPLAALSVACAEAANRPLLAGDAARGAWQRTAAEVAAGTRRLIVAWADGVLAGTVGLDLATPPEQRHRAEVAGLLVHPAFRRRGLGRALLAHAGQEAAAAGRTLLTAQTPEGEGAFLLRAEGWTEAGRIPDYSRDAGGTPRAMLFCWRAVTAAAV